MWAWGSTYQLAPAKIVGAHSIVPSYLGGDGNTTQNHTVTFRLEWEDDAPSRGFFLDSSTGEMLIVIPSGQHSSNSARLVAEADGTISAEVANITYILLPDDVHNAVATGPNGSPCVNGNPIDTYDGVSEFDQAFQCVCEATFGGENCDDTSAFGSPSAVSNEANDMATYTSVGAVVGLFVIVLAVSQYRVRRARRRPVDMSAVQDEILTSLGMGGASHNISKDEFGIMLQFGPAVLREYADDEGEASRVAMDILKTLRGLHRLPNRLSAMLRDKSTTAVLETTDSAVLLRMKRPKHCNIKSATEELFVAALQNRVEGRKISIDGRHYPSEVSVAVPKRVPQELDRHSILRLGVLVRSCSYFPTPRSSTSRTVHTVLSALDSF
jgi:hypothetical protein